VVNTRSWSPQTWIAAIALTLTLLGIFSGAVWWMSAMYEKVNTISKTLESIAPLVTDHEKRLIRLETRTDGRTHSRPSVNDSSL